jgi:hypothetical protein
MNGRIVLQSLTRVRHFVIELRQYHLTNRHDFLHYLHIKIRTTNCQSE